MSELRQIHGRQPPRLRAVLAGIVREGFPLVLIAPIDAAVHFVEYGVPALVTFYGALWLLRGFGVIG